MRKVGNKNTLPTLLKTRLKNGGGYPPYLKKLIGNITMFFKNNIIFIWLLYALFIGQYAQAEPCAVKGVSEGGYLFDYPDDMVVTPDNRWLLVLDEMASDIKIIETAEQQVFTTLPLQGLEPKGLALSPNGATLYVSGAISGNIVVADISDLDPTQWSIKETWQIDGDFGTLYFDPNKPRLLVTDRTIKGVRLLSSTDGSEIAALSTAYCDLPSAIAQRNSQLFVACETSNKVAVFDLETMTHSSTVSVGKSPVALVLHPSLPKLYVANAGEKFLSLINTNDLTSEKIEPINPDVVFNSPRDILWLEGRIWILDRDAAALLTLDPRTEQFESGVCTGVANHAESITAVILPDQKFIYAIHSKGVDSISVTHIQEKKILMARLKPQVLMAGFDPILLDTYDTKFSVLAIVEEGLAPIESVSIEENRGGLMQKMTLVGGIPLTVSGGREIQGLVYEAEFEIERNAFPEGTVATEVLGIPTLSLFGELPHQFHIRAKDRAEQKQAYPNWNYGDWPLVEKEYVRPFLEDYTKHGPRRGGPQVIMAGFAPMLMDRDDTELKVLAIVRRGLTKIDYVKLKSQSSPLEWAMTKVRDLPNGDELYEGIVVSQSRGQPLFPENYEFSSVWNDMFQVVVVDKAIQATQMHRFPDFHVGNYPAID